MAYSVRYVAFIDILGFSAEVVSASKARNDARISELNNILVEITKLKQSEQASQVKNAAFSFFSDCLVISVPADSEYVAVDFLWLVNATAARLFELKLLVRGAVAKGFLEHNDRIVFGVGLIEAYEIESKISDVPRIIVTKEVVQDAREIGVRLESFLRFSTDGPAYIHFLHKYDQLVEDIFDPENSDENSRLVALAEIENTRNWLEGLLEGSRDTPRVFKKIWWLCSYFNDVALRQDFSDRIADWPIALSRRPDISG